MAKAERYTITLTKAQLSALHAVVAAGWSGRDEDERADVLGDTSATQRDAAAAVRKVAAAFFDAHGWPKDAGAPGGPTPPSGA